jgi:Undecaprenyl-phosphate galactose phosphotransferase WbaP
MKNNHPNGKLRRQPWHKRHARAWMGAALVLSDALAFALAQTLANLLAGSQGEQLIPTFIQLFTLGCLLVFWLRGLYPGIGLSPVSEIRAVVTTSSALTLSLVAVTFFLPDLAHLPRPHLLLAWVFSLILLPVLRLGARYGISRLPAWGEPVLILGGGRNARAIYDHLQTRRMLGFDPILISAESETLPVDLGNPALEAESLLRNPESLRETGIKTVLVTAAGLSDHLRLSLLRSQGHIFERIINVPDRHDLGSLGATAFDLDGVFAFEVRQNLNNPARRAFKRALDLLLTLTGGLLILPFLLLLGALVKASSPGPSLYKQTRIGRGGRPFRVWKFRTMVANAEQLLDETLRKNPEMRAEWEDTQKLKRDPRTTPVGRFLRKFSLDELPQLWNVLRGEMSLVGPRPCMEEQIPLYGGDFELYCAVQPGLTGLWQVSGRNSTTYAERVRLDAYYVRNWSVWMDFYILLKTFWVVLKNDGAY